MHNWPAKGRQATHPLHVAFLIGKCGIPPITQGQSVTLIGDMVIPHPPQRQQNVAHCQDPGFFGAAPPKLPE